MLKGFTTRRSYSWEDMDRHLNPNHMFIVRGYQNFRMDRKGRHKCGILTLVRNDFPATDIQVDTNHQAEVQWVKVTGQTFSETRNCHCPPDKELSLHFLDIPSEDCLVVGDFNSQSPSWGYDSTNKRGEEVEYWQIETQLILLNDLQMLQPSSREDGCQPVHMILLLLQITLPQRQ